MFGSLLSDDSSLCHVVHISEVFKNARSGFSAVRTTSQHRAPSSKITPMIANRRKQGAVACVCKPSTGWRGGHRMGLLKVAHRQPA